MGNNRLTLYGIAALAMSLPVSVALALGMSHLPWVTYCIYGLLVGLLFAWVAPAWKVAKSKGTPLVIVIPHFIFAALVALGWVICSFAMIPLGPALKPFLDSKLGWFIGGLVHIGTWYALSYPVWMFRGKPT